MDARHVSDGGVGLGITDPSGIIPVMLASGLDWPPHETSYFAFDGWAALLILLVFIALAVTAGMLVWVSRKMEHKFAERARLRPPRRGFAVVMKGGVRPYNPLAVVDAESDVARTQAPPADAATTTPSPRKLGGP